MNMGAAKRFIGVTFFCLSALSIAGAQSAAANAENAGLPTQYSATAIGQAGAPAGKTFGVNLYITGVTSDEDRQKLLGLLKEKGQTAAVSALENAKDLGRIAPTGAVGTGVRFVRIRPNPDGGQHIVMVTNRPITYAELINSSRSRDYPFTVVAMDIDNSGKGTGSLAPLCKIRFNKKGELEIEQYGQQPFRLANLQRAK
jgi:hypothetical protein